MSNYPLEGYNFYATRKELLHLHRTLRLLYRKCELAGKLSYSGLCDTISVEVDDIAARLFYHTFAPDLYDTVEGSRLFWGHGGYEGPILNHFTPMRDSLLLLFIESLPDLVTIIE